MKKLIAILFILFTVNAANAQEIENYAKANEAVAGYRICVFNGTQQNARSLANGAVAQVKSRFSSSMATKLIYDAPVFKVLVGACLNRTEATVLLARLRNVFPNAFIVNDKISVKEFVGIPSMIDSRVDKIAVERGNDQNL